MDNPIVLVIQTCLEAASTLPVHRRVVLYRALAEICGCPQEAASLRQLADDLEAADHRCREFAFRIQSPLPVGGGGAR